MMLYWPAKGGPTYNIVIYHCGLKPGVSVSLSNSYIVKLKNMNLHLQTLESNEEHEQKGTVYINFINRQFILINIKCKCTQVSPKANFHVIRH